MVWSFSLDYFCNNSQPGHFSLINVKRRGLGIMNKLFANFAQSSDIWIFGLPLQLPTTHGSRYQCGEASGLSQKLIDNYACIYEKCCLHLKKIFFSSYQVINTGHSMAPNVSVEIMVPNSFAPQTDKLFNILDVQVRTCSFLYSKSCC